jgi:hypothetical protein
MVDGSQPSHCPISNGSVRYHCNDSRRMAFLEGKKQMHVHPAPDIQLSGKSCPLTECRAHSVINR